MEVVARTVMAVSHVKCEGASAVLGTAAMAVAVTTTCPTPRPQGLSSRHVDRTLSVRSNSYILRRALVTACSQHVLQRPCDEADEGIDSDGSRRRWGHFTNSTDCVY
jgi:hypothetical protein